jgi:pimeloyl-ACP methyl ester carboxylesterase
MELLQGLDLVGKSLNLIGFSFGGLVAMQFARRYPDKVVRLILMSPGGFLDNRGLKRQWHAGHLLWCCLIPLANYLLSPCCYRKEKWAKSMKGEDPEVIHQVWSRLVWSLFVKRGVAAASLGIMLRVNWFSDEELYKEIGKHPRPVLLLWGEHDNFNSLEVANKVKDYFCNKFLYVIKGAQHIVISDKPQRVYDAVYDFLKFPTDVNMEEVRVLDADRPRLYTPKTAPHVAGQPVPVRSRSNPPLAAAVSNVEVHANMPAPGIIGARPPRPPDTDQVRPDEDQL